MILSEQTKALLDLLESPALLVTPDGTILAANPSARRDLIGGAARDGEPRRLQEVLLDEEDSVRGYLKLCSGSRQNLPGKLSFRTSRGELRYRCEGALLQPRSPEHPATILLRVLPESRASAAFTLLTEKVEALNKEIAGRKQLAEEVRRINAELQAIIAGSPVGIILFDLERTVRMWTPGAEKILGWTAAEMEGRILPVPADQEEQWQRLKTKLERGEVFTNVPARPLRKDGSAVDVAVSGAPVKDEKGNTIAFVGVVADMTEWKRAEHALIQSEKLAITGRLAATIAHEINNPLEAITNLGYLISTDPSVTGPVRQYCEVLMRELGRVEHIVKQTLAFYRDSSLPSRLQFADLVQGVLQLLEPKIRERGLRVSLTLKSAGTVEGFAGELRQVFSNLIMNAIDAADSDGRIEVIVGDDGGNGAFLAVKDDGRGIAEEMREKIFAPFCSTKGEKGTGLGLWVSQGIVQRHKGRIFFETSVQPGKSGTVFIVHLPKRFGESLTQPSTAELLQSPRMMTSAS